MNASEEQSRQIDILLNHISELAMMWRGQPENHSAIEVEYLDTYNKLRALGWDDIFDFDCELPYKNMPKEYVAAHHVPSTRSLPSSWRGNIEEIEKIRKRKNNLLQKLKEWLTCKP